MQRLKISYCGYEIRQAKPTGGKAGFGRNKTSSLQVWKGDRIVKTFRYIVDRPFSLSEVCRKARGWIDNHEADLQMARLRAEGDQMPGDDRGFRNELLRAGRS